MLDAAKQRQAPIGQKVETMKKKFVGKIAATSALLLALSPAVAQADSVVEMCTDLNAPSEVCDCAAEALLEAIGAADYAVYERVGVQYRSGQAKGMANGDAWMEAIAVENVPLSTTNTYGTAHQTAIKGCIPN